MDSGEQPLGRIIWTVDVQEWGDEGKPGDCLRKLGFIDPCCWHLNQNCTDPLDSVIDNGDILIIDLSAESGRQIGTITLLEAKESEKVTLWLILEVSGQHLTLCSCEFSPSYMLGFCQVTFTRILGIWPWLPSLGCRTVFWRNTTISSLLLAPSEFLSGWVSVFT